MILTIGIPTYNRNEILKQNLAALLPQLTPDCELLIIDNCSDVPVAITLQGLLAEYPSVKKRIVRNRVNIGGSANYLRCFEFCETEWLWCLGDDDEITPGRVEMALNCIQENANALGINFAIRRINRKVTTKSSGLENFIEKLDDYSNLLFLSGSLYNVNKVIGNIKYAYQYLYCCAPHVVLLLRSITENSEFVFSSSSLIEHHPPCKNEHYPIIQAALGSITVVENVPSSLQYALGKKIMNTFGIHEIASRKILKMSFNDKQQAKWLLNVIISRYKGFDTNIKWRSRFIIYKIFVNLPSVARKYVANVVNKYLKKDLYLDVYSDSINRF